MSNSLIPSKTGLTLRRTDTLISLTNKLLADAKINDTKYMSDDELWGWWLSLDDKWKWLFLNQGLNLELWRQEKRNFSRFLFDENYNYQADFDWCDKELVFDYVKKIQQFTQLKLSDNEIQYISTLANLTQFTFISGYKDFLDISVLANLTQLTKLDLSYNKIHYISALTNLEQLTHLNLQNNELQNISALANLTQLTFLDLENNRLQNISALANLTQLTELDLYQNRIYNVSALTNLSKLKRLVLGNNRIKDISPLANLIQLNLLYLKGNPINPKDIEWLKKQLPNCEILF